MNIQDLINDRLITLADRVAYLESVGDTETAEFLLREGAQFAKDCDQAEDFITVNPSLLW